ncbi:hypothetical protein L873DRAFT_1003701 [Choiromyces venosus 120613-1]|uniref:Uncharacterized protein n=1 Tax=Choiromyces venosus 120613-1 TaxID=1336337 RepID=A0A3N4IQY8_9PEZI|nr:hypothetical protein L873DRAFT_1003701 [Choiromyces venosus 120613-1]
MEVVSLFRVLPDFFPLYKKHCKTCLPPFSPIRQICVSPDLPVLSPRYLSSLPIVSIAGTHTRSPSPGGRPNQKSKQLISNTTATTTSSPLPTNASKKNTTQCQLPILTTPHTLTLSSEEAAIRKFFVDATQEVDKDKPEDDRLLLRFTSGWARALKHRYRHGDKKYDWV